MIWIPDQAKKSMFARGFVSSSDEEMPVGSIPAFGSLEGSDWESFEMGLIPKEGSVEAVVCPEPGA